MNTFPMSRIQYKYLYLVFFLFFSGCTQNQRAFIENNSQSFDGERAYIDVQNMVKFGPRIPGAKAHDRTIHYIENELIQAGWDVSILRQEINSKIAYNILATKGKQAEYLLGAHYDSRIYADNDINIGNHNFAVPGANDGASGTSLLLEIGRTLPVTKKEIGLLFIDIEDNGKIPGWDWTMGSRIYANQAAILPRVFILFDMIGDKDLTIYREKNSDSVITDQIWESAKKLGYDKYFIPVEKYQVLDDHVPFIEKGVRSVDIIDLDYKYWHTTEDTADKVSAESLNIVGRTIMDWIANNTP